MSLSVKKVVFDNPPSVVEDEDGIKTFANPCTCWVSFVKNDELCTARFKFEDGFKTDGLSVPSVFRRWWPNWDASNPTYNLAGCVHDWLYCSEGAYGTFSRSECDDFLRGIMRESGKKRFIASAADWAVGCFAGGKRHWGSDSLGSLGKCGFCLGVQK